MNDLSGKQIDRYRIISQHGQGGMAVVYHAYDVNLERDVALKLIRADAFAEDDHERLMKRFEREARAQSRFSHPNIAPVYDYGEFDGMPYLVMPYYPGKTLKDKTGKPIALNQALDWVILIANALSYAHQRGVVHRDVKPSNILFDEKDEPILTDFGIAKLLGESEGTLTDTGFGVGTPEYMAPEQWQGQASEASDQYALGVVLYELITGQKPYAAETPVAIALKQMNDPLIQPSAFVPQTPEEVERIIYKALALQAEDRYINMLAFQAALTHIKPKLTQLILDRKQKLDSGEFIPPSIEVTLIHSEQKTIDILDWQNLSPIRSEENQSSINEKQPKRVKKLLMMVGLIVLVLLLAFVAWQYFPGSIPFQTSLSNAAVPSSTAESRMSASIPIRDETQIKENTDPDFELTEPALEPTITITPSPISEDEVLTSKTREVDSMAMLLVPDGEFIFGTNRGSYSRDGITATFSTYDVYLDEFWIDKHEITNQQYKLCVDAGVCSAPYNTSSATRYDYFKNANYADYPVVNVDRGMAKIYCGWVGARLPTEAEWEKAARGTDGREYPWGSYWSMEKPGNFDDYSGVDENYNGDTMPVGSFPDGASPYGVLDMVGNVWEWVADWYHPAIFATEPADNPTGPEYGDEHLVRGGSYHRGSSLLARERYSLSWIPLEEIGFRCVVDE